MSDFLAEARVVIRPDTTSFRAELQAQLAAATKTPLTIPVAPVVTGTGNFTNITAGARGAAGAVGDLADEQMRTGAETEKATRQMRQQAQQMGQLQKASIANTAGLLGLRGAVLTAGTAFIGATIAFQAFVQSLQAAAQLETELNTFQATAQATESEMQAVADAARELGADITLPGVAAQDAAEGLTALSRAGLSVQDSLDGIRGVLQLATAAQIGNAEASELVANALNAFALRGEEAGRIADLLAGASIEAQGSISDMGLALRQAAAAANLAGLTVEDTLTVLTQLARAGLSSSDAGTSLRTALIRLIKPTKDVSALLEELRVDIFDINGAVRAEAFGELGSALSQLTPEAQKSAVALLGGADALRTFAILSRTGTADFERTALAIGQEGLAADLAAARTKGFAGQVENLKNQANTLATTLGTVLAPAAGGVADTLAGAFRGANLAVEGLRTLTRETRPAAGSITELRENMERAQRELTEYSTGAFASADVTDGLRIKLDEAQDAFDRFGVSAAKARDGIDGFEVVTAGVTNSIEALIEALQSASSFTAAQRPDDEGLGVKQLLNRITGFDSAETRARIRGSSEEILSVLQNEQDFLEAQLERDFVKRRPALQRQLEQALFGVVNDINSISASGAAAAKSAAAEAKSAAEDAARAVADADRALLDIFTQRRDDAGRRAAAAGETAGLQDDIRAQNAIQALIKQQIAKVRDRIRDEATRKAAIRALRIALIASRQEEDQLRAEQRQQALTTKQTSIELDIAFAETTGNVSREVAARQRLIALLKKQQAAVKRGTNEWKRLRNEIAEQQQAIKDAQGQAEKTGTQGQTAQQFFFEQLQAQQGFAANLLGNLITGPTAGLVGVPSPASDRANIPDLGGRVSAEAAAATGRAQIGPTAGQGNAQLSVLERIYNELRKLNGSYDSPEAIHQKKVGSGNMDNFAM